MARSQANFWGAFKYVNFKVEYFHWQNFASTKLMLAITSRGKTLIKPVKFWSFSWTFDLAQNEFEKLNYLELDILDFLSSTKIGVFAKSIEIMLSIFTMCSDLLAKRIKLNIIKSYFITAGWNYWNKCAEPCKI